MAFGAYYLCSFFEIVLSHNLKISLKQLIAKPETKERKMFIWLPPFLTDRVSTQII